MSRLRLLVLSVLFLPLTWGCYEKDKRAPDVVLRNWATKVDDWIEGVNDFQAVVDGVLTAYCELEKHVYDEWHSFNPTTDPRYCPPGTTSDPPNPPDPPVDWDE